MAGRTVTTLILPGFGNSGAGHWQTLWEQDNPDFIRVELGDWEQPECAAWCRALNEAVELATAPVVLVAHSLSCLLVAHWAAQSSASVRKVLGALLVVPPDPASAVFPAEATGFVPLPLLPLPFMSVLVASANDIYATPEFSRHCALAWGSRYVDAGLLGHINAASGVGTWLAGFALYCQLAGVTQTAV